MTGKTGEKVKIPTKVVTSETLKDFVQPDLPDNVWLLGTQLPPEELKAGDPVARAPALIET